MVLVIRSNYGDDSIALIETLRQKMAQEPLFEKIYVVYIETGWAASTWPERVEQGENFAKQCGFEVIHLKSKATFAELVVERKNFPSPKFQWCAGFLKGLPLLEWLDEHDPACEWLVALPKRQSHYRIPLLEMNKECPYHGERDVWHPILHLSDNEQEKWIHRAGFQCLDHRSLECDPCIHSRVHELKNMSLSDTTKLLNLQLQINRTMFPQWEPIEQFIESAIPTKRMDPFSMGCGDPFGCGI